MSTKETRKELISASAGILDCNIECVVKLSRKRVLICAREKVFGTAGIWYKISIARAGTLLFEMQSGTAFTKKVNTDGSYMRQVKHYGPSDTRVNVISIPSQFANMLLDVEDSCYVTVLRHDEKSLIVRRATENEIKHYAGRAKTKAVSGVIARSSQNMVGTIYLTDDERKILNAREGEKITVRANITEHASMSFRKYDPKKDSSLTRLPVNIKKKLSGIREVEFTNVFKDNHIRIPSFFMQRFDLHPGQVMRTYHTSDTLIYGVSVKCDVCGYDIDTAKELFGTRHICNCCADADMVEFVTKHGGAVEAAAKAI